MWRSSVRIVCRRVQDNGILLYVLRVSGELESAAQVALCDFYSARVSVARLIEVMGFGIVSNGF